MAFVLLTIASLAAGATTLLPPPPPSSPPALAAPTDLLLEMLPSPVVGMDVMRPQFAWSLPAVAVGEAASNPSRNVVQHAYQIIVVDGGTNVTLWDSGVVVSNRSSNVVYGGKGADHPPTFKAATSYTWRVKWWKDAASGSSDFSNATFLTGLLNESDWKDATFLSCASRTAPPHSPPPPPPKGQPFWSVHSLASFAGRVWLNTIFVVLAAYRRIVVVVAQTLDTIKHDIYRIFLCVLRADTYADIGVILNFECGSASIALKAGVRTTAMPPLAYNVHDCKWCCDQESYRICCSHGVCGDSDQLPESRGQCRPRARVDPV